MGMKSSTVKAIINNKIDNWLETITDQSLVFQIKQDVIITGGCIASMLLGEQVNDYDIYFRTKSTTKAVAEYYASVFNSINGELKHKAMKSVNPVVMEKQIKNIKGELEDRILFYMKSSGVASETQSEYKYFEQESEEATEKFFNDLNQELVTDPLKTVEDISEDIKPSKAKPKYRPVFFSDNAVTLSDKMQLVIRFYGEPEQIHENYDFVHTHNYFDYCKQTLCLHPDALESLLSKTLIYKGSLYPIASIFRIRKFIERGWRITAGQLLKIIWQISEIELKDPEVLREQLIGVDQAYMQQLIRMIENSPNKVDSSYLAKLVDEIFE